MSLGAHAITLAVSDPPVVLDVWDGYAAHLSMLQHGSPWSFELWYSDTRRTSWSEAIRAVRPGDIVLLAIDGATQLVGYADEVDVYHRRDGGAGLTVAGLDLVGPAMRWHADPSLTVRGRPLDEVLTELFRPLGLDVAVLDASDVRASLAARRAGPRGNRTVRRRKALDIVHPQPGETVWSVAERIVRRAGYLIWSAPLDRDGVAVVIDKPAYTDPPLYTFRHAIVDGRATSDSNILDGHHRVSVRDVPTEVTVYANAGRGDGAAARMAARVGNAAIEDSVIMGGWPARTTLYTQPMHVLTQRSRTHGDAEREARRLVTDAMARARTYTCTVRGHGQRVGERDVLYAINTMAHVRDDRCGIDEDMLVLDVAFRGSRSGGTGQTTTLTLGPKDAIVLQPDEP